MKDLQFDTRSALAKECVYAVAESNNLILRDKRRKPNRSVVKYIGQPVQSHQNGKSVDFFISTAQFRVSSVEDESNEVIINHSMPHISFASGGDASISEFVAYVAKDDQSGRCCYVLQCLSGTAQQVIGTIGQAFDQRFNEVIRSAKTIADGSTPIPTPVVNAVAQQNHNTLVAECYYHWDISRQDSEALMRHDGDFLVRRSAQDPNQFVLTGMQSGVIKHLLLVDEDGVVRTKDKQFDSVAHLIRYHKDNNLPITSKESALTLRTPVLRSITV